MMMYAKCLLTKTDLLPSESSKISGIDSKILCKYPLTTGSQEGKTFNSWNNKIKNKMREDKFEVTTLKADRCNNKYEIKISAVSQTYSLLGKGQMGKEYNVSNFSSPSRLQKIQLDPYMQSTGHFLRLKETGKRTPYLNCFEGRQQPGLYQQFVRFFSSGDNDDDSCDVDGKLFKLTHLTSKEQIHMVDVSGRAPSLREASAVAVVLLGEEVYPQVVKNGKINKGLQTVVQIAGINGAKRTADLIPLCHNIPITKVTVNVDVLPEGSPGIQITSTVKTASVTGVEMEALTSVTVAALTVYDMCKAVSHDIQIKEVKLLTKSGGRTDFKRS